MTRRYAKVFFRLKTVYYNLDVEDDLEFVVGAVRVSIGKSERQGSPVMAVGTKDAKTAVLDEFERLLDPSRNQEILKKHSMCFHDDDKATDASWSLSDFPGHFYDFCTELEAEILEASQHFIKFLRWKFDFPAPQPAFGNTDFEWSFDEKKWHQLPHGVTVRVSEVPDSLSIRNTENIMVEYLKSGVSSLALDFFWYAIDYFNRGNTNVAMICGVVALEVSVKKCVAKMLPGSEWFLENTQSPPVISILTDLIQKTLGYDLGLSDAELKKLKNATETRNKIVHRGYNAEHKNVGEVLDILEKTLRRLDAIVQR